MLFHHIGIACKNINTSIITYKDLGFQIGDIIIDNIQGVKICFISKKKHPLLELIEPLNNKSPVTKILKQMGNTPYHNCYECENIYEEIKQLKNKGFLLISKPVKAVALNNKNICFLYNTDFGLLELVEA